MGPFWSKIPRKLAVTVLFRIVFWVDPSMIQMPSPFAVTELPVRVFPLLLLWRAIPTHPFWSTVLPATVFPLVVKKSMPLQPLLLVTLLEKVDANDPLEAIPPCRFPMAELPVTLFPPEPLTSMPQTPFWVAVQPVTVRPIPPKLLIPCSWFCRAVTLVIVQLTALTNSTPRKKPWTVPPWTLTFD